MTMFSLLLFVAFSVTTLAFSRLPFRASASFASVSTHGTTSLQGVVLEDLPYDYKALEPHLGEQTLRIHHDKHHARYVTTANDMIKGTDMENDDVITLIRKSFGKNQALFNNAGQSFNHDFYWKSMKPNGGGKPSGRLADLINKSFGDYDKFRGEFTKAANTVFGSGWAWLVWTPSGLKIQQTTGAGSPLTDEGSVPLLTIDVWEHAYYLNYQNLRPTYTDVFMDNLVNWDAVSARLPKA